MKLATFEIASPAGPLRRIGAAVDGRLVDFAAAYAAHIDRTDPGSDAQRIASLLFPPVTRPRVIRDFLNFEGHMLTAGKALGRPSIPPVWYEVPAYYKGDPDTVSGPDDVVEWPKYCEKFDF